MILKNLSFFERNSALISSDDDFDLLFYTGQYIPTLQPTFIPSLFINSVNIYWVPIVNQALYWMIQKQIFSPCPPGRGKSKSKNNTMWSVQWWRQTEGTRGVQRASLTHSLGGGGGMGGQGRSQRREPLSRHSPALTPLFPLSVFQPLLHTSTPFKS